VGQDFVLRRLSEPPPSNGHPTRWPPACSLRTAMIRFLLICSGALFLGSFAAFYLMVSMLSIATVVSILVGLMLMFGLGIQVGSREPQI